MAAEQAPAMNPKGSGLMQPVDRRAKDANGKPVAKVEAALLKPRREMKDPVGRAAATDQAAASGALAVRRLREELVQRTDNAMEAALPKALREQLAGLPDLFHTFKTEAEAEIERLVRENKALHEEIDKLAEAVAGNEEAIGDVKDSIPKRRSRKSKTKPDDGS